MNTKAPIDRIREIVTNDSGLQQHAPWLRRCFADYIGPRTLAALKTYIYIRKEVGCTVLYRALNALQGAFYISLVERRQKDEKYIFGWFANRVS